MSYSSNVMLLTYKNTKYGSKVELISNMDNTDSVSIGKSYCNNGELYNKILLRLLELCK